MARASPLLLATAASVLGTTAHTTFMYYLAPVALREAGIEGSDWILFTLVAVAMGLTVVPAGWLTDHIPRRRAMRIGLALLAASYATLLAPTSVAVLAVGASLSGIGLGFQVVAFASYVADLLATTERTAAYGRATSLAVLASALGPFLAASVFRVLGSGRTGLVVNALLFAASAVVGIVLTLMLPRMRERGAGEKGALAPLSPVPSPSWSAIARAAFPFMALYVLMGAGYGMTSPYFTVYFIDTLHVGRSTWGFVLAAATALSAIGALFVRRFGPRHSILTSQAILFLAQATFLVPAASTVLLAAAFLLRSACQSTVSPAVNAAAAERAPPGAHARTQALSSLAWNVGWASGAFAGGRILATAGAVLFPVGGTLALAGAVVGSFLMSRGGSR